ncbi:DUF998 domain-containing protein [Pseudonocardia thermophila]|uniref:DUF998 domain-containing protein n=1 Tax=Pseudonocardia thermophila TaxID=1848 RepID=UPI0009373793|nr:DUF998 domain-containing protein [Pseudonocardia thermophila]
MHVRTRSARRWWGVGTLLLAVLALLSAARCVITMVYLGFEFSAEVNPIRTPASYYVFVEGGSAPFTSAAVALAVAALAVLVGMTWAGAHMSGRPTVLFSVWSLCLILAAIFPTDNSPDITSFSGWVHQFAGAGILMLLSFAGLAAAAQLAENPAWQPVVPIVRVLSLGAGVLTSLYIASRVIELAPEAFAAIGVVDFGGLLQRASMAFQIGVVMALALHLMRVSWHALRAGSAEPAAPDGPVRLGDPPATC